MMHALADAVDPDQLNSADEMEERLREIGATRYHSLHPFHTLLHSGKLSKGQVQAWALNRYYYQSSIPIKDAIVISRFRDRDIRREWRHRLDDHDGSDGRDGEDGQEGGIERWLKLTDGLGLSRDLVTSTARILPITRFAVDAYVAFVRERSPLEAVASSLTELFAPGIHRQRIDGMLAHYDFIHPEIMTYFRTRLHQAPRDADFALRFVRARARTPEDRAAVCEALVFKTNVLWAQLDGLHHAYVTGQVPPGAFVPEET
ncbi:pyrroloquinoline quinone biosynthesis protein C [Telmatospirillum siberiense]|uniref:Pyrroloquinoline-quinone synthase n=2 Tax=Telmatospirillum siberiense TaxID=382514 RepID=A0A2N3PQ04_9PROT|nr:pyrroloquinoline quinone biosynthesis protein C [Telmatospirillum siberiense]